MKRLLGHVLGGGGVAEAPQGEKPKPVVIARGYVGEQVPSLRNRKGPTSDFSRASAGCNDPVPPGPLLHDMAKARGVTRAAVEGVHKGTFKCRLAGFVIACGLAWLAVGITAQGASSCTGALARSGGSARLSTQRSAQTGNGRFA